MCFIAPESHHTVLCQRRHSRCCDRALAAFQYNGTDVLDGHRVNFFRFNQQLLIFAADARRVHDHQTAVGHNSPPLGREGLPFFFFHRGIIAKDIDLIFLNFLYYAKRQTFKEVCPFMGFYPNSSV